MWSLASIHSGRTTSRERSSGASMTMSRRSLPQGSGASGGQTPGQRPAQRGGGDPLETDVVGPDERGQRGEGLADSGQGPVSVDDLTGGRRRRAPAEPGLEV